MIDIWNELWQDYTWQSWLLFVVSPICWILLKALGRVISR